MKKLQKAFARDKYLLLLLLPVMVYFVIFHYVPMYGALIAFKDFSPSRGILGSKWVGFTWFIEFFQSFFFARLMTNTVWLSLLQLIFGFPIPIIFALLLNELRNQLFKRVAQTISYLPHFISVVVMVGIMFNLLDPNIGVVNNIIKQMGGEPISFMRDSDWFRTLYVGSGVWQEFGWNSIIYLAALSALDMELYEAARIDGANRWKLLWHITIPGIIPTTVILLILRCGRIMNVGFEKIILMYSPGIYDVSDVISTYVYRKGIIGGEFSFSAAVGLFNSVINCFLVVIVNWISKKTSEYSLW